MVAAWSRPCSRVKFSAVPGALATVGGAPAGTGAGAASAGANPAPAAGVGAAIAGLCAGKGGFDAVTCGAGAAIAVLGGGQTSPPPVPGVQPAASRAPPAANENAARGPALIVFLMVLPLRTGCLSIIAAGRGANIDQP